MIESVGTPWMWGGFVLVVLAVLVFIGAKMTLASWVHVNAVVSLAVVVALLAASVAFSLWKTRSVRRESPAAR